MYYRHDGDSEFLIVDAIDDPVGAASRAVPIRHGRLELLTDAMRVLEQGAEDEFICRDRNGFW